MPFGSGRAAPAGKRAAAPREPARPAEGPSRSPSGARQFVAPPEPLSEEELDQLQALLDQVPAPLEPLDVSMVDGFLCGVLVQPVRVAPEHWLPFITDVDGRPLPRGFNASTVHKLVRRRYAELNAAIDRRQWFDPWVFELDLDAADGPDEDEGESPPEVAAIYPWVAGFVTALEVFPGLMRREGPELNDALVLLYRHLDPDDLEDADDILEAIEQLEPAEDLGVAVEELVRATLLLADIGRPVKPVRASPPRR